MQHMDTLGHFAGTANAQQLLTGLLRQHLARTVRATT
jgi:hypothetical protein